MTTYGPSMVRELNRRLNRACDRLSKSRDWTYLRITRLRGRWMAWRNRADRRA